MTQHQKKIKKKMVRICVKPKAKNMSSAVSKKCLPSVFGTDHHFRVMFVRINP